MRFIRKLLLWIIGIVVLLIVLAYVTGNEHLIRGMRYTYLIGPRRSGDRRPRLLPIGGDPRSDPQPWPKGPRYGKARSRAEDEKQLTALYSSAFVVIQNDSLIFEQYWNGWKGDSVSNSFSVAKSYISVLVGIAMQEGKIRDVFQPVGEFLPEFDDDECKKKIRLRHLLTMSTGLDWSESGANPFSDNAKGYYGHHVRELAISQPCRDEPGEKLDYISGSTQIMVAVLEKLYGMPSISWSRRRSGSHWGLSTTRGGARTASTATSRVSVAFMPHRAISPASASSIWIAGCGRAGGSSRRNTGMPRSFPQTWTTRGSRTRGTGTTGGLPTWKARPSGTAAASTDNTSWSSPASVSCSCALA
jgi:hypothetical protein